MTTRTNLMMTAFAMLALLGAGVAAAAADNTTTDGAPVPATTPGLHGKSVDFNLDPATGTITDYARIVDGQPVVLFSSITLSNYNASAAKSHHFARLWLGLDGKAAQMAVFDANNAALFVRSSTGNTVKLVVPDGVNLTAYAGEPGWAPAGVKMQMGNDTARLELHGAGNVSVEGQTITVVLGEKAHLSFRITGHPVEFAKERRALEKIADRRAARAAKKQG